MLNESVPLYCSLHTGFMYVRTYVGGDMKISVSDVGGEGYRISSFHAEHFHIRKLFLPPFIWLLLSLCYFAFVRRQVRLY